MANKVNTSPNLPTPINLSSTFNVSNFLTGLMAALISELRDHALRVNAMLAGDGSEAASAPVRLKTYVKTALPDAAKYVNGMIIVSNDVGGLTPAFSDGTNWRRTADRAIIA